MENPGKNGYKNKMDKYNADKPKEIWTPYGTITLLPITKEDMKMMQQSLLCSLSSSSEDKERRGVPNGKAADC